MTVGIRQVGARQISGYLVLGRWDAATADARKAVALASGDWAAHATLASAAGKAGHWAEAAAACREALRLDPAHPGADQTRRILRVCEARLRRK